MSILSGVEGDEGVDGRAVANRDMKMTGESGLYLGDQGEKPGGDIENMDEGLLKGGVIIHQLNFRMRIDYFHFHFLQVLHQKL